MTRRQATSDASMTVAQLIQRGPLRDAFATEHWCPHTFTPRDLQLAASDAITTCEPFVALCVAGDSGAAPRLMPAQALRIVQCTIDRCLDKFAPQYMDDEGVFGDQECKAQCLAYLQGQLEELVAPLVGEPVIALPLQWTDAATAGVAMQRALGRVADMGELLKVQIAALAAAQGDTSLSGTVVPLALSDADIQPGALFGQAAFGNDHQGAVLYMLVADRWAMLVCHKHSSC